MPYSTNHQSIIDNSFDTDIKRFHQICKS